MVAQDFRKGEHRFRSSSHGRNHTPHTCYHRADSNERVQKGEAEKQTEGKRTYRKKTDTVRLCADDVLNRGRLVVYHDDYAKVM